MSKREQEEKMHALQQEIYIPHHSQGIAMDERSSRCIEIATRANPKQCCGYARRIGSLEDHTLYRLKVHYGPKRGETLTLPDLFVLTGNAFHPVSGG